MSGGRVLGIDLGTTNTVVAVADGGQARVLGDAEGRRMVPSVVSFLPEGGTVVGYEARERRLVDAANTVYAVKRLIGRPFESPEVARARERFAFEIVKNKHGGSVVKVARGTYALAEISAMVLRELRRMAEAGLGETCGAGRHHRAGELQRAAAQRHQGGGQSGRAGGPAHPQRADRGRARLRLRQEPDERVAVYDLGGGTFDITILELEDDVFEVLATAGDTFLGGEDMDRTIADVMCERFREAHRADISRDKQAYERLKAAAEWAKCQLSNEHAVELTIEELSVGRKKSADLTFAMTRAELEALATPWLDRSFEVCTEALKQAGLKASDLDSVVLVGGSTRMPLCRTRVAEFFGRTPRTDIDPDMVVAQGAAIHGFALAGEREARPLKLTPPKPPPVPKSTQLGVPRQPAFAPDAQGPTAPRPPRRPARSTAPPPPMPDLPLPFVPPAKAVKVSPAVPVRTPRTTIDMDLDELAPPEGDVLGLDELAPSSFDVSDPFADSSPTIPSPTSPSPTSPAPSPCRASTRSSARPSRRASAIHRASPPSPSRSTCTPPAAALRLRLPRRPRASPPPPSAPAPPLPSRHPRASPPCPSAPAPPTRACRGSTRRGPSATRCSPSRSALPSPSSPCPSGRRRS